MVKARICTAAYDAAGDMVCRAPTGSTSCTGGANTGQQLTWDTEGRLAAWQDAPTSPTTTASYLYDGEGQRVAQKVTSSGATTTTTYVGSLAEYTTTGGATTSTDYLYAAGKLVAEAVTSSGTPSTTTLTYLVTNAQGTPLEALDGSGSVTASRLYTPYGGNRYTSDAFLTNYGYTGQRNDATSGLDYYGARYYDPAIAQFTSADTVLDGLSRYGYVGGNPTSATDPSGHQTVAIEIEPGALGGIVSPEGIALGLAGLAMVGATSATTTAIPLAGTPDPASTYRVGDATVVVTGTGDLVVTVPGKGLGSTTTRYSPGEAGYLQWSQAVSASIAVVDTEVYNARTAPTATTTTTTGSLTGDMVIAHAATGAGDGASTPGAGRGNPAASSGAAAGGSTEPPEGDDCTCGTVPGGSGTGAAANPLENVRYTGKVQSAMGNRWASRDYFHAFPDVVDNYGSYGETFPVPGGDGTSGQGSGYPEDIGHQAYPVNLARVLGTMVFSSTSLSMTVQLTTGFSVHVD